MAFLVILGKEKANGQGEKMNSEEKKQDSIFGVPPQKQKNNGTHYQQFNFHRSSFILKCYHLIRITLILSMLSVAVQGCFNYFRRLAGRFFVKPALKSHAASPINIPKISVCYNNLVQVWPTPGRYRNIQPLSEKLEA